MEENHEIISMDNLSLQEKFDRLTMIYEEVKDQSSMAKIQKVPFAFRGHKHFKKYFEPRAVALGPIHHGKQGLEHGQKCKEGLAEYFLRHNGMNYQDLKDRAYKEVEKDIKNLRDCYKDEVTKCYDDEKLAWMLFVDGSSLLAFIGCTMDENPKLKMKKMKIKNDIAAFGLQDIFLLENQLPLRLLNLLIEKSDKRKDRWIKEINDFVDEVRNHTVTLSKSRKEESSSMDNQKTSFSHDCPHLLHLLRKRLLGDQNTQSSSSSKLESMSNHDDFLVNVDAINNGKSDHMPITFRNIKELKSAGIRVRPHKSSTCLRDIDFRKVKMLLPTLFLPPMVVDDWTAPKFMNLVAYEMCPDFFNDFGITSYVSFLDSLIDHPEDVKHLRDREILHNVLGSDEEVAILFNEISTDLIQDGEAYSTVKKEIQKHYKKVWTRWVAIGYHKYFSNPWTIFALVGALVGLALSFIQTLKALDPCTKICNANHF